MANAKSTSTSLDDQPAVEAAPVQAVKSNSIKGANLDAALSGSRVLLTVYPGSDEDGHRAVDIGHNGYLYQVPRGVPCEVPAEVAQIMSDAVVTSYKPGPDATFTEVKTPRYAFTITPV